MEKRRIYLVDSPIRDGLYYCLCVNVPEDLHIELPDSETSPLVSFEHFFFENKNEIEMRYYVIDPVFAGILYFFGSFFGENGRGDVNVMVDVLDKVFVSHSLDENLSIISDHNLDLLLVYLDEIEKELMARDDEIARVLVSRCHDLSASILSQSTITLPSRDRSDKSVISYVYGGLKQDLNDWLSKDTKYELHAKTNSHFSVKDAFGSINGDMNASSEEMDYFIDVGNSMTELIQKVAYEYDMLSKEDRSDFMNLWLLLVSTRYRGLLSSSYLNAVKTIVQR